MPDKQRDSDVSGKNSPVPVGNPKKFYSTLEELQADVDTWLTSYNTERPHSGKHCFGKTPMQTFRDSIHIAKDKNIGNMERISDNLLLPYQAA